MSLALKARLAEPGATLVEPLRATPFERFFFREPVNGYVFEVIDQNREGRQVWSPVTTQRLVS